MAGEKEPVEIDDLGKLIAKVSPYYEMRAKLKKQNVLSSIASQEFFLSYNSSMEGLEPLYFWILDFLENGGKVEKLIDTFSSSVGSGHFSELMGKGTRMQEESMKIMQTIGVLIKSVIQIIYDLRQFKIRLHDYKAANSKNKEDRDAGIMALKQIWLDNVDVKRGNSGIKAMTFSQQGTFGLLLNAFFAVNSQEDIAKIDLNDIVKRVLQQRISEFEEWKKLSERELGKRYKMEKAYLRSQVDSLRLYSRWAAPYLKAAEQLKMGENLGSSAALVKAFNTILLQLAIMQKKEIKVNESVLARELPKGFEKVKNLRAYYGCVLVDFKFRGIPQKVDQHYAFGGKADVTFSAYALNEEELLMLNAEMDNSAIKKSLELVKDATETSLGELEEEIRSFLDEKEDEEAEKEKEEEKKKSEDVNPFSALFGIKSSSVSSKKEIKKAKSDEEIKNEKIAQLEKKGIKQDNYYESMIRKTAEYGAKKGAFGVYDVYKKAHGMASAPFGDYIQQEQVNVFADVFEK